MERQTERCMACTGLVCPARSHRTEGDGRHGGPRSGGADRFGRGGHQHETPHQEEQGMNAAQGGLAYPRRHTSGFAASASLPWHRRTSSSLQAQAHWRVGPRHTPCHRPARPQSPGPGGWCRWGQALQDTPQASHMFHNCLRPADASQSIGLGGRSDECESSCLQTAASPMRMGRAGVGPSATRAASESIRPHDRNLGRT